MHKNRPFLFTLLILLVLDLLVFFTEASTSQRRDRNCFEQVTEEVMEALCEIGEELEEETESLCNGLFAFRSVHINFLHSCSKRLFYAPAAHATSLACGWSMPLLI